VKVLLDSGVDVDPKDEGKTPLHHAAQPWQNHVALEQFLLASGADKEAKDKDGKTPLRYAAADSAIWQALVDAESDKEA
jgi:ankyrin repeat protein